MYYIEQLKNNESLELFIRKMNQSFKERSTEKIPYQPISKSDIKDGIILGAYTSSEELIGGLCIEFIPYFDLKGARIYHVWTDVNYRKKGIAIMLMEKAEQICNLYECEIMVLNVANIYNPAVRLYKKVGFKEFRIIANLPKTFYLIQMIKQIKGEKISKKRQRVEWIISKVKFRILYKTDSSPTFIHKIYINYWAR
ncbi:GNAT family N-acetyltransferase [Ruminococcus sp.]